MSRGSLFVRVRSVSLLAAFACCAGVAVARPPVYTWRIPGVPDFDQQRGAIFDVPGLPNFGNMYCFPTAATNWMNYIASRGYPNVEPGPGWHGNASGPVYNEMTNAIADMGDRMSTDAVSGTGITGILQGVQGTLFDAYPGDFTVQYWSCGRGKCPTYTGITVNMIQGAVIILTIGWYAADTENPGNFNRTGGHAVSLSGADDYFLSSRAWRFTDPGFDSENPDQPFNQSPYFTHSTPVEMQNWTFNGTTNATLPRLMAYTSAFVDGYTVITPKFGWAPRPDLMGVDQLSAPINPTHPNPGPRPITSFNSPDSTPIDEVLLHPQLDRVLVKTRGNASSGHPGGLNAVFADGSVRFVRSSANAQAMVFSRNLELFVLEPNSLVRYREDDAGSWIEMSRRSFAQGFDALEYDDSTDEVLAISAARGVMTRFDQDLIALPVDELLPTGLGLVGPLSFDLDPRRGEYVLADAGTGALHHIAIDTPAGARSREHILLARQVFAELQQTSGGGGGAGKVSFQDLHLTTSVLVPAGGIIREYTRTATGWQPTTNSRFAGLASGPGLTLSESRTNFDPALHTGPGWQNVFPVEFAPTVEECPADLNQNGVVDFADVTIILANFNKASLLGDPGDADLDSDCDFSDITKVLSEFGRICD